MSSLTALRPLAAILAISVTLGELHLHSPVSLGNTSFCFLTHLVASDQVKCQCVDGLACNKSLQAPESDVDSADDSENNPFYRTKSRERAGFRTSGHL